ncbi:ATP-dependent RNA helicase [Mortierella sp. AD011]|nr:ATP-dependent RNA helicase [Mortierella sp. AD011]
MATSTAAPSAGSKRKAKEGPDSSRQPLPKRRRGFASANAIYPDSHFYVQPDILDVVGNSLARGKYILICGHRQSGKSTTCQALLRWFIEHKELLQQADEDLLDPENGLYYGYEIYILTIDGSVVVDEGESVFWETICRNLNLINPTRFPLREEEIPDNFTFQGFFSIRNINNPRPVILIIDEASRLAKPNGAQANDVQEIINNFLSILRTLKDDRSTYCIHSVALCGTESIKDLTVHESPNHPQSLSPFSHHDCWKCGRFKESDIKELLSQFAGTISTKIDVTSIASDIFELTLGHKGLTGTCCYFIESTYRPDTMPIVSLDDWKMHTIVNLQARICSMNTYRSAIGRIPFLSDSQKLMLSSVLRFGIHRATPGNADLRFLLAEGLVIEASRDPQQKLTNGGLVEIFLYLPHLYADQTINSSTNEPSEYAFQTEFSAIIRKLVSTVYLAKGYRTLVEVKERDDTNDRSRRMDILVRNCGSPSCGYELVVAPTLERFREHVRHAAHYAKVHRIDDMFMVNLCPKLNVDYFSETPETPEMNVDYSEGTMSTRRSSRFVGQARPNYNDSLQQPPEPFAFPENVTVVNVTLEKKDNWEANLVFRNGKEKTITIKGSEWKMW